MLDIGCGRGEFLELMREIGRSGAEASISAASPSRSAGIKGLTPRLPICSRISPRRPSGEFDGIFSFAGRGASGAGEAAGDDPVVRGESAARRSAGDRDAEPRCLAIFATYFYLDPTHTRPVPHQLLEFYMEEAGIGSIEVHELSPAVESIPEIAELPESFRKRFFGGLDYAIVGRKL